MKKFKNIFLFNNKKNTSLFLFNMIIFLKIINYCLLSKCDREKPFLKSEACEPTCTTDEINKGKCIIENDIIKTQWLNNIINIGGTGFMYANIFTTERNNLYYLVSSFPSSNLRIFYILNSEGYGFLNKNNPHYSILIDDPDKKGRYESEIFTIKLHSVYDYKEYLISIPLGSLNVELYDFYEGKIYYNLLENVFGPLLNVHNDIGAHLKLNLYSNENINTYLIGLIAYNYFNGVEEPNFYLKKINFKSLDIKNIIPNYETKNIKCSRSKIVSCYETLKNFIVCFFLNENYEYIMIVYSYELEEKTKIIIDIANSNEGYEEKFFKCIHFFGETGVFGYFTNEENPIFVFKFKKYLSDNNEIIDFYKNFSQLKIKNYFFFHEKISMCDMCKIEDKKFYFISTSLNKDILYIILIYNYKKEDFVERIYSIKNQNLYNFLFHLSIRITLYKNYLALASNNYYLSDQSSYSSLIIFSYPNSTEVNIELSEYLYKNNNIKIYNLTLELNGEYIIENNIFGYIYSGVQIIENCDELKDIYLANLDNEHIDNYFLPQKEKIKLIIPKQNSYEPFICKIKYACVVTEPEYSEYKNYPQEIIDTGETNKEEQFYESQKKKYIGKYSFYNLNLKYKLTAINCENNCDFCYSENKKKCLSCHYINKQNNECLAECNANDFFNESCNINNNNEYVKDDMIKNIKNSIENNNLKPLIENIIDGDKKDIIIKDNDTHYQVTSTENQKNNKDNNKSKIILGECEKILKEKYEIDINLPLLIFKIDYFKPGSLIPIIGYEIFHPKNYSKLDLNYCKNVLINFDIPCSIDENNLFKYDPDNEYYKDECYPYTTQNGTDILLNDRHIEYNDNNLSLCENNCVFNRYELQDKITKCECEIKTKQILISELINRKDILYNNFTNQTLFSNMVSMKCYYTLFTKEGLYKNIGSYILIFTYILFIISTFIFYKCGYILIEKKIQEIIDLKENKINKRNSHKFKGKKKKKFKIGEIVNEQNNQQKNESISNVSKSNSKLDIKSHNILINSHKIVPLNSPEITSNKKRKIYNDYDLNNFPYKKALQFDKRTFFDFYISLLKTKHPLIFSFIPIKDYNLIIIKIDLFFLFFSIYNFINALFFNESIIHKIYEDQGKYNLKYLLPQILYSFLISHFLSLIIKYFFLTERNIYEIKNEKNLDNIEHKAEKEKRIIIIKYIIFYISCFIFLTFLWYYIASFGSVYQNTQIYLIKNTLISFGISFIYPFVINLIPCFLRIFSLKDSNREFIYKMSIIFQLI